MDVVCALFVGSTVIHSFVRVLIPRVAFGISMTGMIMAERPADMQQEPKGFEYPNGK